VPAGTVLLRSKPGPGERIAHPPAVSLPRVLELAGVDPAELAFVSLTRPNGTLTVLQAPDLTRPAPFADGPPLVWLDADSVRFFRPVRDDGDLNAADNFATAGEDLAVRARQGELLEVRVDARPARPRAGERVRLEARVTGAPPGSAISVRWRFGDGGERAGAATTHRWKHPGVYAVVASAEGDDDSAGASEPLLLRVGDAKPRTRRRSAGGGDADPLRAPAAGPVEAAGGSPEGSPVAPLPDPAPAGTAQPSAAASASASRRRRPLHARTRRRRASGDARPASRTFVEGVLVAATVPEGAAAAAAAARTGTESRDRDLTIPIAGLAAFGLVGAGALRERRRSRP
jgi:hypothetical protein